MSPAETAGIEGHAEASFVRHRPTFVHNWIHQGYLIVAAGATPHGSAGANHYHSGPGQRETLWEAVGVCTERLHRPGFSLEGE